MPLVDLAPDSIVTVGGINKNEFSKSLIFERLSELKSIELGKQIFTDNNSIQVQDLEEPWNSSGLKIILLKDDELKMLTIADFQTMSPRQKEIVIERMLGLKVDSRKMSSEVTTENLQQLSLGKWRALKGPMPFINQIPPELLALLTVVQRENIDFTQTSQELRQAYFNPRGFDYHERIQKLTLKQIVSLCKCADLNPSVFRNMDLKVLSELDLSILSDAQFDTLFSEESHKIQNLKFEQIYAAWERFGAKRLLLLSENQIKNLDFSQVSCSEIFQLEGKMIGLLDPDKNLQQVLPFLCANPKLLQYLSEDQIEKLDFSKVPDLLNHIPLIFNDAEKIRAMTWDQFEQVYPHFTADQFQHVTLIQFKSIDFKKIHSPELYAGLFYKAPTWKPFLTGPRGLPREVEIRIKQLSVQQIRDSKDAKGISLLQEFIVPLLNDEQKAAYR